MLDVKFILENKELVEQNCKNRNIKVNLEGLMALDEDRRELLKKIESLRAKRNTASKTKPDEQEMELMKKLGQEVKQLEGILGSLEQKIKEITWQVPNLTHPDSPVGGEEDYKVVFTNREPAKPDFPPKDHEELMTGLGLLDFVRGAKVTGSKFYFYKNELVKLNQALINYALDITAKYGYQPMETPDLVKAEIMEGSGFNPRGEEKQTYEIKNTDLDLIGTAEITVLGYHANEVLDLTGGPKKYAALSHCFRTEAGSYGQAVKGLYRVHQFTKLEMFIFCEPASSEKYLQELVNIEKEIVDGLELPYRVIEVASGDLGGPAYRKYDIEAWMTMKGTDKQAGDYGEITSASNCTDYQSRRLNVKYKDKQGKNQYVHTLNGTAAVLSRFPLALVENHQQKDGSIIIPEVLKPYCGFDKIKKQ